MKDCPNNKKRGGSSSSSPTFHTNGQEIPWQERARQEALRPPTHLLTMEESVEVQMSDTHAMGPLDDLLAYDVGEASGRPETVHLILAGENNTTEQTTTNMWSNSSEPFIGPLKSR